MAASPENAKLELKALMPEDAKQAITTFAPSAPGTISFDLVEGEGCFVIGRS